MKQPITILIAALGGEGGGVLAEWLVETALQAGYPAQSTSIPGVAQRTGGTTYYVEVYPEPLATLGGRQPVLSLLPVPGCIDLAVASELLEAGRLVLAGMVSPDRTAVVTSVNRTLTTAEKLSLGDGRFDSDRLLAVARDHSRKLLALDMMAMTRETGTVVSAVMFGAIAASRVLPFEREAFEAVIKSSGVGVENSLRGFAQAWDTIDAGPDAAGTLARAAASVPGASPLSVEGPVAAFPLAARDIVATGYARLREYQDQSYADLYLERASRVLAAERKCDPKQEHGFALTRETARFLALWMAFDDIVRVADLKCRASRFARVRSEVAAREGDLVRIVDYFKPGIAEFSGLLPAPLARRLTHWDRQRQARGKAAFGMALHVRTDGIVGFAILRVLAGLRWLRPLGARYAQEQAFIGRWLASIEGAAREDWALANEIALCGRLIKGYGATNERGKANLAYILDHLAAGSSLASAADRAVAIRQAREAALADEGGKALDKVLQQHRAPPRPIVAQPIRWQKNPRASTEREHHAA